MKFRAILADPPWRFKTYSEAGRNRCPDWKISKGSTSRHYETMSTEQICAMKIPAADDSCLFLRYYGANATGQPAGAILALGRGL